MWGGQIRFTTPMKFAIGLIALFIIGGISGVMHSSPPADLQQTDTLLRRGALPLRAVRRLDHGAHRRASTYWFPKITGRCMSEKLGNVALLVDVRRR